MTDANIITRTDRAPISDIIAAHRRVQLAAMITNRAATGDARPNPRTFRDTGLLPLVRLRANECKWPVSHHAKAIGGFLFCGRQTGGNSYCAKHQNLSARKH